MTHHRNRSEGLNIGEGFPTTYSSFAVTADNRADGRRSSASNAAADSASMKRRTSNPPMSHQPKASRLRGYLGSDFSPASPRFSFEKSGVSTAKSIQGVIKDYRKRWIFVLFFLAFSALMVFGVLLPVSRGTAAALRRPGAIRREINYRSTRVKPSSSADGGIETQPNRFSRWAAALFGPLSASQPVVFPAGMGDLELPDYAVDSVTQATMVKMADKQPSRRSQKRRTEDAVGRDEREHPSRVARREQLESSSLAEEDRKREAEMAKQRQIRRRVMERVARAFKSGISESPENVKVVEDSADGEHVLDTYEAAHPETVELDSDYNA